MKVVYLTWGETPRSYGVFGSQVIEQFVHTQSLCPKSQFYFISAIPLLHSGFVREKFKYLREIKKIKKLFKNIPFFIIPIYAPQNVVNSSKRLFKLMHIGANWHLKNKLQKINPEIVHCRSYHAAYAALNVKNKYKLNYKIIFDGRGLWPEEISLKKKYTTSNKNYRFLKNIELELLHKSDAIIAVSDTMKSHYQKILNREIHCIYLSSDVKNFMPQNNTNPKETIFCYIGAISKKDTWHITSTLSDIYIKASAFTENPKLLIITTTPHETLEKNLQAIPSGQLILTTSKSKDELNKLLKSVTFGILPFRKKLNSVIEKDIGSTMLATKTVEYLAAGIPIICNKYCGGVANLIKQHAIGITYNPISFDEITKENLAVLFNKDISKKCIKVAAENFDYKVNALKYKKLYKALIN